MAITLQTRKRIRLLEETLDLLPKQNEVPPAAQEVLDRMRAGARPHREITPEGRKWVNELLERAFEGTRYSGKRI